VVSGENIDSAVSMQELTANLFEFQQCGYLCDTVIVADDGHVKAHSVVLAAVSPVFKRALKSSDHPVQHTIVLPGMQLVVVSVIIQFVYTGRIVFPETECDVLTKVMSAAFELEIKLHISRYLFYISSLSVNLMEESASYHLYAILCSDHCQRKDGEIDNITGKSC